MGLFGALFAGVSGLSSQSNKIGIISNNISNVNTVGFKQGQAAFDTLVVPSGTTTFSPGGVIGTNQQLVSQQGLIQATSSSTDAAITGAGFFVVNTKADGSGNLFLTRAGSFTQDDLGNFVNANGFFLQGVPVTTPSTALNQINLKTVNVNSSATGTATPTSLVTLAANLNAAQSVLLGSGEIVKFTGTVNVDSTNANNTASDIIVPTSGNGLVRGDSFTVLSTGQTTPDVFTYGGISKSRDVTATIDGTTTTGNGDNTSIDGTLDSESLAGSTIANNGSNTTISVTVTHPGDYKVGQHITISGASSINGIPASQINGEHVVTSASGANPVTFTVATAGTGGVTNNSTMAITANNRTFAWTGNMLNATTAISDFLGTASPNSFTANALEFSITAGGTTSTFTYNAQPDATTGKFNTLNSLATAINESSNSTLTARVNSGRLYVSATDANQAVSFTNGDPVGDSTHSGIDWTQELDFPTTAIANVNAGSSTPGVNIFNTLLGLANKINAADPTNLIASINNPTGTATLSINEANPESHITFSDGTTNTGSSLMKEFNFTSQGGGTLTASTGGFTTGLLDVKYDPTNKNKDMSSGAIPPQFSKDITIFDALGNSHTIAFNVVKISTNTWGVEFTAVPATDVQTTNSDGQIASGTVVFKGDGTLASVSTGLANPITVNWTQTGPNAVGANATTFTLNLNGLTQSASAFNVSVANQNGSSVGELTGVSIDQNGFVIESFSNGQTQKAFQVPLGNVNNPNGLNAVSGDAYQGTLASGQINFVAAGTNGTGTITPSALEQSNVDLSTQLTNMIVAQQAYGANSKVLTVADRLLQELDQIIQ